MARALKAVALAAVIAFTPVFSMAQQAGSCAPMPQVEEMAGKYKELPVSFGKAEGGVDPYDLGQRERQNLDRRHGVAGWSSGLHHSGCSRDRLGSGRAGR
jgi:hypothetical protein